MTWVLCFHGEVFPMITKLSSFLRVLFRCSCAERNCCPSVSACFSFFPAYVSRRCAVPFLVYIRSVSSIGRADVSTLLLVYPTLTQLELVLLRYFLPLFDYKSYILPCAKFPGMPYSWMRQESWFTAFHCLSFSTPRCFQGTRVAGAYFPCLFSQKALWFIPSRYNSAFVS